MGASAYLTLAAYEGESASFLFLPFLTRLPTGTLALPPRTPRTPRSPQNPRQASASRERFTDSPGTRCAETPASPIVHGRYDLSLRSVCRGLPRAESGLSAGRVQKFRFNARRRDLARFGRRRSEWRDCFFGYCPSVSRDTRKVRERLKLYLNDDCTDGAPHEAASRSRLLSIRMGFM